MECPSCRAPVADPGAAFCPRCSAPLDPEAAEPTTRLDALGPNEAPTHLSARVDGWRTRLESSPWVDGITAAALGFLALVAVGGVLVVAAKLNFPELGSGSSFYAGLNAFVIAGLGSLGVPAVLDGVGVEALPFGALLACGLGIMWATRNAFSDADDVRPRHPLREGAMVGLPFALLCWAGALLFRFRGDHPVAADAGQALIIGAFWGTLFASAELAKMTTSPRVALTQLAAFLRARTSASYEGLVSACVMLGVAATTGLAAVLLWIIVALASGAVGSGLSAGDAFAYLVYFVAFLPNLIVALIAMGFGAPIELGARVGLGGEIVGRVRDYSLLAWDRGDAPALSWLLVLIPVVACVAAGFLARRRTSDPSSMLPTLLFGSAAFSVCLTLLAAIGPVRLAGLTRAAGYAGVAPDVMFLLPLSFLGSGVLAWAGWKLGEAGRFLSSRVPQAR